MKTVLLLLLLLSTVWSGATAQWHGQKNMRSNSCALADSLLGPAIDKVSILVDYNRSADSSYVQSGSYGRARLRMVGRLFVAGRGPVRYPAPILNFIVGRGRLASWLVSAPMPPRAELVIDDTAHIDLGPVQVAGYSGPAEAAIAPLAVQLLPAWALSLARARQVELRIDSDTLDVPRQDVREFSALYRFATCDSIPTR